MVEQPKSKFTKVKIQPSLAYQECVAKHKKNTPNPIISKLDQIDREGVETTLQKKWDQKVQHMSLRSKVNHSLINYTTYTHFD